MWLRITATKATLARPLRPRLRRVVTAQRVARSARRSRLPVRDALGELGAAPLELDRWVSPLPPGGVQARFDDGLLELQEVQLHRLAAARLALGAHVEVGDQRDQLAVVLRQPGQRLLEMSREPVAGAHH